MRSNLSLRSILTAISDFVSRRTIRHWPQFADRSRIFALSQRDPNPLSEKALAIHPEQWKHAETEHFIYHFVHSYVATPVSVEAEFHYRVIAKGARTRAASG